MFVSHNHFLNCYLQELLRVRPILRNFLKARIYKVSEIIRPFERKKSHEKRQVIFFIYVISSRNNTPYLTNLFLNSPFTRLQHRALILCYVV